MSQVRSITIPPTSATRYRPARLISSLAGLLCLCSVSVFAAEQEWWFDVEVIIFKRDVSVTDLSEKFVNHPIKSLRSKSLDLLTPYLKPDLAYIQAGLSFCRASNQQKAKQQYEQDFAFPKPPVAPVQAAKTSSDTTKNTVVDDFQYQVATEDIFNKSTHSTPTNSNKVIPSTADVSAQDDIVDNQYSPQDISIKWLEWQIPKHLPCVYAEQTELLKNPFEPAQEDPMSLADIDHVPVKINGLAKQQKGQAFLLPQNQLHLNSLYKDLNKQRDLKTILHSGWRQEVKFGQDKAQSVRLFAGQNYGNDFMENGRKKTDNKDNQQYLRDKYVPADDLSTAAQRRSQHINQGIENTELFNAINNVLADDSPLNLAKLKDQTEFSTVAKTAAEDAFIDHTNNAKAIWQLDGDFKVFLKYVGRTPYLHIESDLDFRQPLFDPTIDSILLTKQSNTVVGESANVIMGEQDKQPNVLNSVNVKQFKQVISKQLHYFDHPLFGMLVNITRYNWPSDPEADEKN